MQISNLLSYLLWGKYCCQKLTAKLVPKKHQLLKNPTFGSSGEVIFSASYIKLGHFICHIAFYKEIKVELDCLLRLRDILAQSCYFIRRTPNFGHFRGAVYPGSELPSLIRLYQFVHLPGGYLWSKNQVVHRTVTWCIFILRTAT
jgi:hypothetical protein